jgi:hypothetical protein
VSDQDKAIASQWQEAIMSKTLAKDLLYLFALENTNQVAFYAEYPIIRKKHKYLTSEFRDIYIAYRNEKAQETV